MTSLPERLRAVAGRTVPFLRRNREFVLPLVLIVLGVALGLASLSPSETLSYADTFTGTLAAGNSTTLLLPVGQTTYEVLNLSAGACGLHLYPATVAQWEAFNATGRLPPTWIGCANRTAIVSGDVADLVLVNTRNVTLAYQVDVQAYLLATPFAWVSLPATAMTLAGLLLFVPRFVLRRAASWRDDWDYKKKK